MNMYAFPPFRLVFFEYCEHNKHVIFWHARENRQWLTTTADCPQSLRKAFTKRKKKGGNKKTKTHSPWNHGFPSKQHMIISQKLTMHLLTCTGKSRLIVNFLTSKFNKGWAMCCQTARSLNSTLLKGTSYVQYETRHTGNSDWCLHAHKYSIFLPVFWKE